MPEFAYAKLRAGNVRGSMMRAAKHPNLPIPTGLRAVLLAALAVAALAPQATAAPLFSPKTDFTVGGQPISVTSADFDGDGDPDLATANEDGKSVSVLLGFGDGGFRTKTDFPVANGPVEVRSADFDGNGNPDLATANYSDNTVSVLLSTGAPNTQITKGPNKIKTKKKRAKVTVNFTSEDAGATGFRCKLDKGKSRRCSSPYSVKVKAKRGKGKKHKVSIKAKDEAGNVGKPATVKFRVVRKR
jgi:hypothetical protein